LGGVNVAAARLALVVHVSPEVNDRAVHAVVADGLRRGVGYGRDGLVGVEVWFPGTAVWYLGNGRVVTHFTYR
jgi:hypothetical protein